MITNDEIKNNNSFNNLITDKMEVIKNNLLGDYNSSGDYVISEKIVEELVLCKKIKKNVFNNSIFAYSKYNDIEYTFEIKFKKNTSKNIALSELFLLETIEKGNGIVINTIKTLIASYTDAISDNFVEKAYLMFNLSNEDIENDTDGQKYFESDEYNTNHLKARNELNELMSKLSEKDIEKIYDYYFSKRIEALKKVNNNFTLAILSEFNNELAKVERFLKLDSKGYSDVLDLVFERISTVKNSSKTVQLENNFLNDIVVLNSDFNQIKYSANDEMTYNKIMDSTLKQVKENIDKLQKNTINKVISKTNNENLINAIDDKKISQVSTATTAIKEMTDNNANKLASKSKETSENQQTQGSALFDKIKSSIDSKKTNTNINNKEKVGQEKTEQEKIVKDFNDEIKKIEEINNDDKKVNPADKIASLNGGETHGIGKIIASRLEPYEENKIDFDALNNIVNSNAQSYVDFKNANILNDEKDREALTPNSDINVTDFENLL